VTAAVLRQAINNNPSIFMSGIAICYVSNMGFFLNGTVDIPINESKKPKHQLKLCICYIFKNSKFLPLSV